MSQQCHLDAICLRGGVVFASTSSSFTPFQGLDQERQVYKSTSLKIRVSKFYLGHVLGGVASENAKYLPD